MAEQRGVEGKALAWRFYGAWRSVLLYGRHRLLCYPDGAGKRFGWRLVGTNDLRVSLSSVGYRKNSLCGYRDG